MIFRDWNHGEQMIMMLETCQLGGMFVDSIELLKNHNTFIISLSKEQC